MAEKERLRIAEGGIDLSDFGREEGTATEGSKGRQGRIVGEQTAEFLPGGLWLDVGEIAHRQFGTTYATNG